MARSMLALAFGVLLLLPVSSSSIADEDADPWYTSLAEAKRVATEEGRLLFVYLDPRWVDGRAADAPDALSDTALRTAADTFVVVRLDAGVENPESDAVRCRYSLWKAIGAGVVIDANDAAFGQVYGGDTDRMLTVLRQARIRARHYVSQVEMLKEMLGNQPGKQLRGAWQQRLVNLHYEHSAFERALPIAEKLDATGTLSRRDLVWHAFGLSKLGRLDDAQRVYERLVEDYPEDPHCAVVRISLATLRVSANRTALLQLGREDEEIREQGLEALLPLLYDVQSEGDISAEACVRFSLLNYLEAYAEFVAQCTWVVENDPKGLVAVQAWIRLAALAMQWNDPVLAKRYLEALIATHPDEQANVPHARDVLLPAVEQAIEACKDPDRRPFELRVDLPDESPEPGTTVTLKVRLENRSDRPFHRVRISCYPAGPVELLSPQDRIVEPLGPQAEVTRTFDLEILEAGSVHLVFKVERTDIEDPTTRLGRHVRIDAAD